MLKHPILISLELLELFFLHSSKLKTKHLNLVVPLSKLATLDQLLPIQLLIPCLSLSVHNAQCVWHSSNHMSLHKCFTSDLYCVAQGAEVFLLPQMRVSTVVGGVHLAVADIQSYWVRCCQLGWLLKSEFHFISWYFSWIEEKKVFSRHKKTWALKRSLKTRKLFCHIKFNGIILPNNFITIILLHLFSRNNLYCNNFIATIVSQLLPIVLLQ